MSDFLVLGLVPGTQIQITFLLWLLGASTVVVVVGIWFGHRAHLFRNWLITTAIYVLARRAPAKPIV